MNCSFNLNDWYLPSGACWNANATTFLTLSTAKDLGLNNRSLCLKDWTDTGNLLDQILLRWIAWPYPNRLRHSSSFATRDLYGRLGISIFRARHFPILIEVSIFQLLTYLNDLYAIVYATWRIENSPKLRIEGHSPSWLNIFVTASLPSRNSRASKTTELQSLFWIVPLSWGFCQLCMETENGAPTGRLGMKDVTMGRRLGASSSKSQLYSFKTIERFELHLRL